VSVRLKGAVLLIVTAALVGGLVLMVVRDRASEPYVVSRSWLTGWNVVEGEPEDPWIVAARPPAALSDSLFRQLTNKTGRSLIAPPHADLPLVLRAEYADALQGVWATDEVMRAAQNAEIETTNFEPVCMGHKSRTDDRGTSEFFFVVVASAAFERLRDDLQPDFPEHAGIALYNPQALPAVIPIAATDRAFDRWWPLTFDPLTDCQAKITVD